MSTRSCESLSNKLNNTKRGKYPYPFIRIFESKESMSSVLYTEVKFNYVSGDDLHSKCGMVGLFG